MSTDRWILFATLFSWGGVSLAAEVVRPNIVWIIVDDMSPNFSCYGEELIRTPHVDALAERGVRFDRAFVTAPVCSPCRSALVTGCYQTTIGAHHHRSGRGTEKIRLPAGVEPLPVLFQRAGYFTCNGGPLVERTRHLGKTDYNFEWDPAMYDGNDWSGRKEGQPFFAQVQLHGGKYRGQGPNHPWNQQARQMFGDSPTLDEIRLPPYYPADPVLIEDWANYLRTVLMTDRQVGDIVDRLRRENILDQTIILFMTDHGISHARGKQFLYEEGLRVPLVVAGPGLPAGVVRDDLIEHIDVAALSLARAGIPIPAWMQGRDVLSADYRARPYVYAARDRCDETVDRIRSVRSERFRYIRNYMADRPLLQANQYKDGKEILQRIRQLHEAGRLNPLQEELLFRPTRPAEELYDLASDPYQLHNLASDPERKSLLDQMRQRLASWEESTKDLGRQPEASAMFKSDAAVYEAERAGRAKERSSPTRSPTP